jgi:hypothetical protein
MDLDIVSGAGSVVSNVLDYSKWLKAMIDSSGPISTDSHRQLRTGRTLLELDPRLPSPFTGPLIYTLGWITGAYGGYQFYYHSGGMEGFGAELIFFPALKYGITTFGNTAVTSNLAGSILMFYLVDQKLRTPLSERFDWSTEYGHDILFWPRQMLTGQIQKSNEVHPIRPKRHTKLLPRPAESKINPNSSVGQLYWHVPPPGIPKHNYFPEGWCFGSKQNRYHRKHGDNFSVPCTI